MKTFELQRKQCGPVNIHSGQMDNYYLQCVLDSKRKCVDKECPYVKKGVTFGIPRNEALGNMFYKKPTAGEEQEFSAAFHEDVLPQEITYPYCKVGKKGLIFKKHYIYLYFSKETYYESDKHWRTEEEAIFAANQLEGNLRRAFGREDEYADKEPLL